MRVHSSVHSGSGYEKQTLGTPTDQKKEASRSLSGTRKPLVINNASRRTRKPRRLCIPPLNTYLMNTYLTLLDPYGALPR